ncbi:MAG: SDR family NAD(P)-dependent oxidoreductase [Rhodoferax sp.]
MSAPIALVIGATSGVGKATAELLAAQGATVIVSGRREAQGAAVVQNIQAAGGRAQFLRCDVSQEESVRTLIAQAVRDHGRLDWAVNAAAVSLETELLADSDTETFKTMIDINLLGLYHAMKYQLKQMLAQGGGAIVNVGSIAGVKASPLFAPYVATKFGVSGMTKTAALEYAASNIRINAVAPGGVRTELLEGLIKLGKFDEPTLAGMHPMRRIAEPIEIGHAIAWLLSPQASFVTGHILSVDGGMHA